MKRHNDSHDTSAELQNFPFESLPGQRTAKPEKYQAKRIEKLNQLTQQQ